MSELLPPTKHPKDKRPRVKTEPADAEFAARVNGYAKRTGRVRPGVLPTKKDVEAVAIQRRWLARNGIDLVKVWDWYEAQEGNKRLSLPRVSCGHDLTRPKVWAWIYEVYDREVRNASLYAAPTDPHPDTRYVLADAMNRSWPDGVEDYLHGVVDRSVRNFNDFLGLMDSVSDASYRENRWLWKTIRDTLGGAVDYLTQWFRWVHRSIRDWEDWSGNLSSFVWTRDHKRFVSTVNRIIAEYCGRVGNEWNEILAVPLKSGRGR